jgi:hypothetical protein
MSYQSLIQEALGVVPTFDVPPQVKFFSWEASLTFPVLFCREREARPFRVYEAQTRTNCSLCSARLSNRTSTIVVDGMEWMPAGWPIKSNHGICYPAEHRASILGQDICTLGEFVDRAGDAVACLNLRGSGASVPEHIHAQLHDTALPVNIEPKNKATAFPLLTCAREMIGEQGELVLYRLPSYPAFALVLQGPWELLSRWMVAYLCAANIRPHNFALAAGGQLVVIPRGLEKASDQENRYGASEMLGLITPVTHESFLAIRDAELISNSLRLCGVRDSREQLAIEEHALWGMEYVCHEHDRHR